MVRGYLFLGTLAQYKHKLVQLHGAHCAVQGCFEAWGEVLYKVAGCIAHQRKVSNQSFQWIEGAAGVQMDSGQRQLT